MKNNTSFKYLLLILATLIFNFLFWEEAYGVNVLLYSVFLILITVFFNRLKLNKFPGIIFSLSLVLTSLAIMWHSSLFTIVMYYITFILFVGWLHQPELKTIFYTIASSCVSFVKIPSKLINNLPINNTNRQKFKKLIKLLKLSLIPLVVLTIFYLIYVSANPVFESFSNFIFSFVSRVFDRIFKAISFQRIFFVLTGLVIGGWFLFINSDKSLFKKEEANKQNLERKRKIRQLFPPEKFRNLLDNSPVFYRKKFALSQKLNSEFISATVLLFLVNALLLIVNIIDIKWVWFGFEYSEKFNLKQFVHEGTYLLIISILLSMAIMLYFFRRNLNFYSKSKLIKTMSFVWIIQNVILTISVFIRNLHYITYFGLAYKRIGVIIFLIAVVYGLYSLFVKINYRKTAFYLLKKNSLFIYGLLIMASLLNWDGIIARHNLNHPFKNHMETCFLLSLSDKVLPMIDVKSSVLDQDERFNTYASFEPHTYREYYQLRVDLFLSNYRKHSWLSWNYEEWKGVRYFENKR